MGGLLWTAASRPAAVRCAGSLPARQAILDLSLGVAPISSAGPGPGVVSGGGSGVVSSRPVVIIFEEARY